MGEHIFVFEMFEDFNTHSFTPLSTPPSFWTQIFKVLQSTLQSSDTVDQKKTSTRQITLSKLSFKRTTSDWVVTRCSGSVTASPAELS